MNVIDLIISNNSSLIKEELFKLINISINNKLESLKHNLISELSNIDEDHSHNVINMGRTKLVKYRFRNGKLERNKRLSNTKNYRLIHGELKRMSVREQSNRRLASRITKYKRASKRNISLRKRLLTLRKRKALGL